MLLDRNGGRFARLSSGGRALAEEIPPGRSRHDRNALNASMDIYTEAEIRQSLTAFTLALRARGWTDEELDRWADALDSGKYRQGREHLCTLAHPADADQRDAFCCLGVLWDLKVQEHAHEPDNPFRWDGMAPPRGDTHPRAALYLLPGAGENDGEVAGEVDSTLPPALAYTALKLNAETCDDAAGANDHGATFPQIAEAIRAARSGADPAEATPI